MGIMGEFDETYEALSQTGRRRLVQPLGTAGIPAGPAGLNL